MGGSRVKIRAPQGAGFSLLAVDMEAQGAFFLLLQENLAR